MKRRPSLILFAALAVTLASTASAYHFDPRNASVRLHGKLMFTPNGGGGSGQPFTCGATVYLKTRKSDVTKNGIITNITFVKGGCNGIVFSNLPWPVSITNKTSGFYYETGYISQNGDCHQDQGEFEVAKDGTWSLFNGICLSGKLQSHPNTTIK